MFGLKLVSKKFLAHLESSFAVKQSPGPIRVSAFTPDSSTKDPGYATKYEYYT